MDPKYPQERENMLKFVTKCESSLHFPLIPVEGNQKLMVQTRDQFSPLSNHSYSSHQYSPRLFVNISWIEMPYNGSSGWILMVHFERKLKLERFPFWFNALRFLPKMLSSNYSISNRDAQKIVKICSKERCHAVLILTYMIVLLRCFQNVSFNFVSRTCNRVAHLIAKSAISSSSPLAWVGDFPG